MDETLAKMDADGQAAIEELRPLVGKMSADQREGFMILLNWITRWYLKAGYKRLMHHLFNEFK